MGKSKLQPTILELRLRFVFGSILWIVSASLTTSLFISLSNKSLLQIGVMFLFSTGLEGSKILLWRMNGFYRAVAIGLVLLSLVASFGAALTTVKERQNVDVSEQNQSLHQSSQFQLTVKEIDSLDQQIAINIQRLSKLPDNYVSAGNQLNLDIKSLRNQRQQLIDNQDKAPGTQVRNESTLMFQIIAAPLGISEDMIILILLMALSVLLEISILALFKPETVIGSGSQKLLNPECTSTSTSVHAKNGKVYPNPVNDPVHTTASKEPVVHTDNPVHPTEKSDVPVHTIETPRCTSTFPTTSTDDFLKSMMQSTDLPYLRGRDSTAQSLGISQYQAKQYIAQLIKSGRIGIENKRYKLVQ